MSQEFRAIFENGLFRPLDPVSIGEHNVVSLVVVPTAPDEPRRDDALALQRNALAEMFAEADSLPLENPHDNFSGRDHDLVLYGWKK